MQIHIVGIPDGGQNGLQVGGQQGQIHSGGVGAQDQEEEEDGGKELDVYEEREPGLAGGAGVLGFV